MNWLAWLNPMNWIKILSLITSALSLIKQGIEAYQNAQRRKAEDKKADEAAARLKEALKKGDDDEIAKAGSDTLNGN